MIETHFCVGCGEHFPVYMVDPGFICPSCGRPAIEHNEWDRYLRDLPHRRDATLKAVAEYRPEVES